MGGNTALDPNLANGEQYTIEWSGFRPLNIRRRSRGAGRTRRQSKRETLLIV